MEDKKLCIYANQHILHFNLAASQSIFLISFDCFFLKFLQYYRNIKQKKLSDKVGIMQ